MNVMISFDSRSKKRIDTLNSPFISRDDLSISIFIKRVISRVTVIPILNEGLIITFFFFFFSNQERRDQKVYRIDGGKIFARFYSIVRVFIDARPIQIYNKRDVSNN